MFYARMSGIQEKVVCKKMLYAKNVLCKNEWYARKSCIQELVVCNKIFRERILFAQLFPLENFNMLARDIASGTESFCKVFSTEIATKNFQKTIPPSAKSPHLQTVLPLVLLTFCLQALYVIWS